jgi:hypothetical protein
VVADILIGVQPSYHIIRGTSCVKVQEDLQALGQQIVLFLVALPLTGMSLVRFSLKLKRA